MRSFLEKISIAGMVLLISSSAHAQFNNRAEQVRVFSDLLRGIVGTVKELQGPNTDNANIQPTQDPQSGQLNFSNENITNVAPQAAAPSEAHLQLQRQMRTQVRDVQNVLNWLGYNAGPADGLVGEQSRNAISSFQQQHYLPITGEIDQNFLFALKGAVAANQEHQRLANASPAAQPAIPPQQPPQYLAQNQRGQLIQGQQFAPQAGQIPPAQYQQNQQAAAMPPAQAYPAAGTMQPIQNQQGHFVQGQQFAPQTGQMPPVQYQQNQQAAAMPPAQAYPAARTVQPIQNQQGQFVQGQQFAPQTGQMPPVQYQQNQQAAAMPPAQAYPTAQTAQPIQNQRGQIAQGRQLAQQTGQMQPGQFQRQDQLAMIAPGAGNPVRELEPIGPVVATGCANIEVVGYANEPGAQNGANTFFVALRNTGQASKFVQVSYLRGQSPVGTNFTGSQNVEIKAGGVQSVQVDNYIYLPDKVSILGCRLANATNAQQ